MTSKDAFKKIRDDAHKLAGELGTIAENTDDKHAAKAYDKSCEVLDALDDMGTKLGYLNQETLEYL